MERNELIALVRLSITDPEKGAAALIGLGLPLPVRWMLMAAAVLSGVVLAYSVPALTGQLGAAPSPFMAAALQGGANVLAIGLMAQVGRLFGGHGRFEDALLLVGWLQVLMIGAQVAQMVAMVLLPPFAGLVMIAAIGLFFWVLTGFICGLHGFQSRFMVLMGVFGTLFAVAFVVSFVLIMLGIELPGLDDV